MTDLNALLEDISRLINANAPSLADLRVKMIELDEYVHSSQFEALNYNDRSRFQTAYKELRDGIRKLENPGAAATIRGAKFRNLIRRRSGAGRGRRAGSPGAQSVCRTEYGRGRKAVLRRTVC